MMEKWMQDEVKANCCLQGLVSQLTNQAVSYLFLALARMSRDYMMNSSYELNL